MTAADLIDEARDFHASFTKQQVPDRAALRALTRAVERIVQQVAAITPEALAETHDVVQADVLTAVAARAGIALPDHVLLLKPVRAVLANSGVRVKVDTPDHATSHTWGAVKFPSATLLGGKLHPLNLADLNTSGTEHGWEAYDGLEVRMVRVPAELALPTDVVPLPSVCRPALVMAVALFMAGRTSNTVRDLPLLPAQATDAEAAAVAALAGTDSASTWRIA